MKINNAVFWIIFIIIIIIISILGFNYLFDNEGNDNEAYNEAENQNIHEIEVVKDNQVHGVLVDDEELIGDNIYSFNLYNMDESGKFCTVSIMITQGEEIVFIEQQNVTLEAGEVLQMQKSLDIPQGDSTIQALPECRVVS